MSIYKISGRYQINILTTCRNSIKWSSANSTTHHIPIQKSSIRYRSFVPDKLSKSHTTNTLPTFLDAMKTVDQIEKLEPVLFDAITNSNVSSIKSLISRRVNVNARYDNRTTALIEAVKQGNIDIVTLLLDAGSSINASNNSGITPILQAIIYNHLDIYKLLESRGAETNVQDINDSSPLTIASFHKHNDFIKYFIEKGSDVNHVNQKGITPLIAAISSHSSVDTLKLLLDAGAYPSFTKFPSTSSSTQTDAPHLPVISPLNLAARLNQPDTIALLVSHGADINEFCLGSNAVFEAVSLNHVEALKQLISLGADLDFHHPIGIYPVYIAVKDNKLEALKLLVENGAKLTSEAKTSETYTTLPPIDSANLMTPIRIPQLDSQTDINPNLLPSPLFLAVQQDQIEMFEYLMQTGRAGSYNQISQTGYTLAHAAVQRNNVSFLKTLAQHNIPLNTLSPHFSPPFLLAVENCHLDVIRFYVEHGYSLNTPSPDPSDLPPLNMVVWKVCQFKELTEDQMNWFKKCIDLLLDLGADINSECPKTGTPLTIASAYGNVEICKHILSRHNPANPLLSVNVRFKTPSNYTALHHAVIMGDLSLVKRLVHLGARVNIENNQTDTPISLAREHQRVAILMYLMTKV